MHEIIRGYQKLFSNRNSAKSLETIQQLESIIRIELLDELTHPRVRKNPQEKLKIATDRIECSELNPSTKQDLILLYKSVYENVNS